MTKYREILRLQSLGINQTGIAGSCGCSRATVRKVLNRAKELEISWPLKAESTDAELEEQFFFKDTKNRRINLDPGYVSASKMVLASTKDHAHRIYLGKGIFAEITLRYYQKTFQPWEWTYPDYRTQEYIDLFNQIRKIYMQQLRESGIGSHPSL